MSSSENNVPHRSAYPAGLTQTLRPLERTRETIESVRAGNPIEEVIGHVVDLRTNGRRLVGHCPFHDDPTPSFVVYAANQSFYCFGCGVGGDVFKFLERLEGISFAEAVERLGSQSVCASRVPHTPIPPPAEPIQLSLTAEHFALITAVTEVYHAAIFAQPVVLEYLAKRCIDLAMLHRHRIGYATGDDLAKYFRFRGWSHELANDLGLFGPRGEYFRDRILIPEWRAGQAIYLVGRATKDYQKAKYLGLPGAPKPLYGLESIRGADEVYVCEGPMDLLTLIEWGYPTVALLGSHLRHGLVNELANARRIMIVTDTDEPGRQAARQLAETFGARARIVPPLPNAKDVNELATQPHGREIFADLIQQAS